MHMYVPFNVQNWTHKIDIPQDVYLSAFGVVAWIYLIITQIILKDILKLSSFTNLHFIIWTILELILMSLIMMILFGENLTGIDLLFEYWLALKQTVLVGVIPYSGVIMYFQLIKGDKNLLSISASHLVKIQDSNGDLKLVVDIGQLLFLRSADNYVEVHYIKDNQIKKELVRTTLKILDDELADKPIKRCQRSFMVNINRVSVLLKNSKGFSLELNGYDNQIPVSKNYKQYFVDLLRNEPAL